MTYWVCQIDAKDRRVVERLAELGLEPWRVPGFGYCLVKSTPRPQISSLSVDGFIRLLPDTLAPSPLPDDTAEAFMATCRAQARLSADLVADEGEEPMIAGFAREALANILRQHFKSVTITSDRDVRLSPARSGPRPGADIRRAIRAGGV